MGAKSNRKVGYTVDSARERGPAGLSVHTMKFGNQSYADVTHQHGAMGGRAMNGVCAMVAFL